MLDPISHQRAHFQAGTPICLADGQEWILPGPAQENPGHDETYEALISSIVMADNRRELLRAELALGIHLIRANYDIPPLLLGAMLDFPEGDPALASFQDSMHEAALGHVRAHRSVSDVPATSLSAPRVSRPARRFGFFSRARASMSA